MVARISANGVDLSGPLAYIPSRGSHGQTFYDETSRRLLVWDDDIGFWMPSLHGIVSSSAPLYVADDFKAPTISATYAKTVGNDGQAVAFAVSAADPLGIVVGTTGDAGTGIAADGLTLAGPLAFTAGVERTFRTKVKVSAITNVYLFIGFTDVLPSTTLEEPISLSGTTFTSNATDACGLLFDTAATTDTIRGVGVATDADATAIDTGLAWVADTYKDVKIVITAEGTMKAYLDGTLVATVTSAVATTATLCPIIVAEARSTATRTVSVDYFCAK